MARPNSHKKRTKELVRILHADGTFSHWIPLSELNEGLLLGIYTAVYEKRPGGDQRIGWTDDLTHKDSPIMSQSSMTPSDMLAYVGLSRFPGQEISRGRYRSARIKGDEIGKNPGWKYQNKKYEVSQRFADDPVLKRTWN